MTCYLKLQHFFSPSYCGLPILSLPFSFGLGGNEKAFGEAFPFCILITFFFFSAAAVVKGKKSLSILNYLAVKVFVSGAPDKTKLPPLKNKKKPKPMISDFNVQLLYMAAHLGMS